MKFLAILIVLACGPLMAHSGHSDPHGPKVPAKQSVVAVVYSDFHCGPCVEVHGLLQRIITEKEQPIRILFKHAPSKQETLQAHEASLAAAQQGKFWEMHDLLFKNQKANYSDILKMAKSLNLDMKRFQTALDGRYFRNRVISELTEAKGMGVAATPTIFINGQKFEGIEQLKEMVEQVLAPPPEPIDPEKIHKFDLANSPSVGPEDAPITLVEYSDFRCGFCGAHSRNVTQLCAAYPGKIRRVFKNFPIQVGLEGRLPHHGALAAKAQGKFWEMYHALMKAPLKNREDLMNRAKELGLDMARFEKDLSATDVAAIVERDIVEGDNFQIRMTPTTFVNGKVLTGRHSLESLKRYIDALLVDHSGATIDGIDLVQPTLGGDLAGTVIEFFGDFKNEDSRKIHAAIQEFRKNDKFNIRVEFQHYPSLTNQESLLAHHAAMAAHQQGKFWEMSGLIFGSETVLSEATYVSFAIALRMDGEKFAKDLKDQRYRVALKQMISNGNKRDLKGQSAVFLNGIRVPGIPDAKALLAAQKKSEDCCGKVPPQPLK